MAEKRERIGKLRGGLLLVFVGAVEGIQALLTLLFVGLFVNGLLALLTSGVVFLCYKIWGVEFFEGGLRKIILLAGGIFWEMIPLLNALPALFLSVMLTILIVKKEDARYNEKISA